MRKEKEREGGKEGKKESSEEKKREEGKSFHILQKQSRGRHDDPTGSPFQAGKRNAREGRGENIHHNQSREKKQFIHFYPTTNDGNDDVV